MRTETAKVTNSQPRGLERATRQKTVDKLHIDPDIDGLLWQSPSTQRRLKEFLLLYPLTTPSRARKKTNIGGRGQINPRHKNIQALEQLIVPTACTPVIYRVRI